MAKDCPTLFNERVLILGSSATTLELSGKAAPAIAPPVATFRAFARPLWFDCFAPIIYYRVLNNWRASAAAAAPT